MMLTAKKLRQHRTIQVCGLRSRFFRQMVQIFRRQPVGCQEKDVQYDGIKIKQDVRRNLCGVALNIFSDRFHANG